MTDVPREVDCILLADGRSIRLKEPLRVESMGHEITVPVGFVSDLASVPRFFWGFFPPWGLYSVAAIVHDYLYVEQALPRRTADQIFLDLMRRLGVGWWTRRTMYRAVRLFGRYGNKRLA